MTAGQCACELVCILQRSTVDGEGMADLVALHILYVVMDGRSARRSANTVA